VTARFSNSTGIPVIPDNDDNASPRGFAVRFNLPEKNGRRVHTDTVSHSTPHFPARNGAEFGEFLAAIIASPPGTPSPSPVEQFVGGHPGTLEFVTAPKPFPISFATEGFFGLNAFKFIAADGKETYVRYEWVPVAGLSHLSADEAKSKSANYLSEELKERVGKGPIQFKYLAQIAEEGDPTDNIQTHWPESRKKVELGTLTLESFVEQDAEQQQQTIFDPIPRVDGIEPSDDPILEFRAALYLISGRERRADTA
jgi:catalase